MMKALLINASPKPGRSTSRAIAEYLGRRLGEKGVEVATAHLGQQDADLLEQMDRADIVVISAPLNIDSLPSGVMAMMEEFAAKKGPRERSQVMMAVVNCGFPESGQTATAITICSIFAKKMGFAWAGGLPMGMGMAVQGKDLEELGGRMRRPRKAFDLAAEAVANGKDIPLEAVRLLAKPAIPTWLFLMMAGRMWKREAAANGCEDKMGDAPYR